MHDRNLLGKGGFGEVYKMLNRKDKKYWAIKVIMTRSKDIIEIAKKEGLIFLQLKVSQNKS